MLVAGRWAVLPALPVGSVAGVKLIVEENAAALSRTTAAIVLGTMLQDRRTNLSLTAGATPVGTYAIVAPAMAANPDAFADAHFYNFDEVSVPGQEVGLTLSALQDQLYGPAGIQPSNLHNLDLDNADAIRDDLRRHGGLDLVLMGLGTDGHFCGNMPGVTQFGADIYTYDVHEDLPFYEDVKHLTDPMPDRVVTFGAPMILRARQAVLIVTGEAKAGALASVLGDDIDPALPATVLRLHSNLVVIADRAAASRLD